MPREKVIKQATKEANKVVGQIFNAMNFLDRFIFVWKGSFNNPKRKALKRLMEVKQIAKGEDKRKYTRGK